MTIQEKHIAKHPLPISNGYSGHLGPNGSGRFFVQCGRCNGLFHVDREWVERYFAKRRAYVDRSLASGFLTRGQHLDAMDNIATDEGRILQWLEAQEKVPRGK